MYSWFLLSDVLREYEAPKIHEKTLSWVSVPVKPRILSPKCLVYSSITSDVSRLGSTDTNIGWNILLFSHILASVIERLFNAFGQISGQDVYPK